MENNPLSMTVTEWYAAIATEADTTAETVTTILDTYGVKPQSVLPRARTLNIKAIHLEGLKHTKEAVKRFSFEWSELSDGIWALLSQGNSKGKSSILSTIKAALQGRFPGNIKRDVWSWIDALRLTFTIDHVCYSISLQKEAGETDPAKAVAILVRRQDDAEVSLYQGPAGDGLKDAMEDLFMDELGFDHFHAYKKAKDVVVEHGWPAMSSAFFIAGPGPAIFGDHTEDGLPIRLIQLFIGLPWISTYTAISTALKRMQNAHQKAATQAASAKAKTASRAEELNQQLEARRNELAKLPDRSKLRSELGKLDGALARAQADVTALRNKLTATRTIAQETAVAFTETRRRLQQAKDEVAAGYVFRKLKPVCCPACETGFAPGRFEAAESTACGLCGNTNVQDTEDSGTSMAAIEAAVQDADAARKTAGAAVRAAEAILEQAEASRGMYLGDIQAIEQILTSSDNNDALQLEIAKLEGRLEELGASTTGELEAAGSPSNEALRIIQSAEKLTKAMMDALQTELMSELEREVFGLTERFGVRNLESFSFKAHKMAMTQGGVETTFSGLNSGENLRMRVATALATLKVARSRGFGRHPGLIVLDSPAASEMSPEDFTALIDAVSTTVEEIPGIQVLVGAVLRPELEPVIPSTHRQVALGTAGLF
ncbi:hypothetical protein [Microvirgula aerodenitrificans]|uniref:hypothetical protein n=1 Tax=Microvirgula aerodenitrificans TaxID=57480 RepID=UPI000AC541B2|nr:hypothetical protein [Microvirgula aerodenitrificans]